MRDLDRSLPAMIARLRRRGTTEAGFWRSDEAVLWVGAFPWEEETGGWTGPRVVDTGRYVIGADANLFDLDLLGPMQGSSDRRGADTATELALLLESNSGGFARVDGDFAIAAWDKVEKRLVLSRDRWGQRPLAYTVLNDGGVLFASLPSALVEHQRVSRTIDPDYLAAAAAHVVAPAERCAWQHVRMIPEGVSAIFSVSGSIQQWQRTEPPRFETRGREAPLSEAARQLRFLLGNAVERRVPQTTRAAIWMSGGYDSPAVYAAGRATLDKRRGLGSTLVPVSLSYPEGDRGREDELIQEIAAMWNAEVTWVYSQDVPLLAGAELRARDREDPYAHPFEPVQRALAKAARACGCRVVLDGNGGDQAFSSAELVRADALQTGEWGALYSQYRRSHATFRQFARSAVLPLMSRTTREWISQLRGRELLGYWDSVAPEWIHPRASLTRAARAHVEPDPGESLTAFEARYYLTSPHMSRVISWTYAFGLEEGIALRSPLLDHRVLEFVARRPAADRFDGFTTKRLLRESVRGLLPEAVLAPRTTKTGTPVDYARREYGAGLAATLRRGFSGGGGVRLVEMGIVRPDVLERTISLYERGLDYQLGHRLLSTMQAEWWVAGQLTAA